MEIPALKYINTSKNEKVIEHEKVSKHAVNV